MDPINSFPLQSIKENRKFVQSFVRLKKDEEILDKSLVNSHGIKKNNHLSYENIGDKK
jgi:hypothetical protein